MDTYTKCILFILALKVVFILLAVTHFYYKITNQENTKKYEEVDYWKSRVEFIFTISMSILMIYLFSPRKGNTIVITGETKILLFLFSGLLFITAKWENFIYTSKWFQQVQNSLR
jgi:succinate dehydrogenase hydrophobic anchor subunit